MSSTSALYVIIRARCIGLYGRETGAVQRSSAEINAIRIGVGLYRTPTASAQVALHYREETLKGQRHTGHLLYRFPVWTGRY